MGRKQGGKNFGNFTEEQPIATIVTEQEKEQLPQIFTCIQKDFIGVKDLMDVSGLSYETCAKIIREVKAVSDTFRISGYIHRSDYFMFLSRRFEIIEIKRQEVQGQ